MLNLSNFLSLLRLPLAILFLVPDPMLRVIIIVTAMLTDIGDGFLARRYKFTTKFGAILDPIMDKFFAYFVFGILLTEQVLCTWQVLAMLSRDLALLCFSAYVFAKGYWKTYVPKSLRSGKLTTALQFLMLLFLALQVPVWPPFYALFYVLGILFFVELLFTLKSIPRKL